MNENGDIEHVDKSFEIAERLKKDYSTQLSLYKNAIEKH